jgi:predicted DsbA family dithiol-disulfide isomerase
MVLDWRGFELHPETPVGGIEVARVFGQRRSEAMRAHLARFSASFGVEMGFPPRMQNTRRALAVGEIARAHGRQDAFRDAAMKAYWREDADLEDIETLDRLAQSVGLEPDAARAVDSDPRWLATIDEVRAEATELGVPGIPTFVFGEPSPDTVVVGCQPLEVLRAAAQAATR